MSQTTSSILLVRPYRFFENEQTLADNFFQADPREPQPEGISKLALEEFHTFAAALLAAGVEVEIVDDTETPATPDSIFPNNWFSTHSAEEVGAPTLVLYPMRAENRRAERRPEIIAKLRERYERVIDLTAYEDQGQFLESTGSLVLDRVNKIAYASRSPRTDEKLARLWGEMLGYRVELFSAVDARGAAIYHTNVLMNILAETAVLCGEAMSDTQQRHRIEKLLADSGRRILEISLEQMYQFCGNLLELRSEVGQRCIALSGSAWHAFDDEQKEALFARARPVVADLRTIERYSGGSARCMIAELF